MGKTRNLRRSKKVVKPKRTRSRVSKKNGKKTYKKRYSSRKKRWGGLTLNPCNVYYNARFVDLAIACEEAKIENLKTTDPSDPVILTKIIEKQTNLMKMMTAKMDKLKEDLNKETVTFTLYGKEVNDMSKMTAAKIDTLNIEIVTLHSKMEGLTQDLDKNKITNEKNVLMTSKNELQSQLDKINKKYDERHKQIMKEVTVDNFHTLPDLQYQNYGEEGNLHKQIAELNTRIAELDIQTEDAN